MADVYIVDCETKKIVSCVTFSPDEFSDFLTCSKLIGSVKMSLFDGENGIMENYIMGREDFIVIH